MADEELAELDPFDLLDAESQRLERHFSHLGDADWSRPTRCEGWSVRDVLAHLAGDEDYNLACLDDAVDALFARAKEAGVSGLAQYNDWNVSSRESVPVGEVLDEWREKNHQVRRRLRERGRDATLTTAAGPYPVGFQAFHLAMEAATHADDVDAPVATDERSIRQEWRARVVRWGLRTEHDPPVEVKTVEGRNRVNADPEPITLDDAELVEAAVARLPDDHPLPQPVRDKLRSFA